MRRDLSPEIGFGSRRSASFAVPVAPVLVFLVQSYTSRSSSARHLRACPRLSPLPGTPVLGSLLREYSGLRACSSWQPIGRTLELRRK
ncbi:hypothetical protein Taro_041999 [Colocasia esculenta]|uniref:Uncharacterized protein n=1 Tax=Colocasia esculenta TaxID=4460 RepID=A0A843WHA1_COLES|nr:hypothetical protein [Colocasia esculenta]